MAKKEDNLIPFTSDQNREKAKINGQKGGIASGIARREKATMRKTLEMMLNETNKKGISYKELATLGLIKGAINGNANNYKTILETIGELTDEINTTPTLKIEVVNNEKLEGVLYDEIQKQDDNI